MTEWNEFSVSINREAVEAVSSILMEMGSSGVAVSDRMDFAGLPEYGFDTLWALDESKFPSEGAIVKGYFHQPDQLERLKQEITDKVNALKDYDLNVDQFTVDYAEVNDDDWSETWKKYYHPVPVTRYMTIVPQWEDYKKRHQDERLITLDPGLAFGTGTHPTTQLCLQLLETSLRGGEHVLDVGTGSGVLSIASAYLGASQIEAYDLDDIAVSSAKSNIALNDLGDIIKVDTNDLLKGIDTQADLIVANILAEIIEPLIPDAMDCLKENGYFISSGIIKEKKDFIINKLEDVGFQVEQVNQMGDWVAILARKPIKD